MHLGLLFAKAVIAHIRFLFFSLFVGVVVFDVVVVIVTDVVVGAQCAGTLQNRKWAKIYEKVSFFSLFFYRSSLFLKKNRSPKFHQNRVSGTPRNPETPYFEEEGEEEQKSDHLQNR